MLKRLKTDRIDLLYQHRVDPAVLIEDIIGRLTLPSAPRVSSSIDADRCVDEAARPASAHGVMLI